MIRSTLRLAALAVALASAGGPSVAAEVPLPVAPADVWLTIRKAVERDGKYAAETREMPGRFMITSFSGDPQGERAEIAAVFYGRLDANGMFAALGAMLGLANIAVDAPSGTERAEKLEFRTDIHGQVIGVSHEEIIADADGRVLSAAPVKRKLSAAQIRESYERLLKYWSQSLDQAGGEAQP